MRRRRLILSAVLVALTLTVAAIALARADVRSAARTACVWNVVHVPLVAPAHLSDVAVVAPGDVWMIGSRGPLLAERPVVLHYDGSRLRIVSVPLPPRRENDLYDVAAHADDDVWLSGETRGSNIRPLLLHWDGRQWRRVQAATQRTPPDAKAFAIAAISPSDAWFVGMQMPRSREWRGLIEHWDGRTWRIVTSPIGRDTLPPTFVAVTAVATDDVWAGGKGIAHWDGHSWRIAFTPNQFDPATADVNAVTASDAHNVWFAGVGPLVARFDGNEVREVRIPRALWGHYDPNSELPTLRDITTFSPRDVWAAGTSGILHYDGSWHRVARNTTLAAIGGDAGDDLWAVGGLRKPFALHRHCP